MKKTLDNQEYLGMMKNLLLEGKSIKIKVVGQSMTPFLVGERDWVYIEPSKCERRKGDIVFYQRVSGDYILHRIYRVKNHRYSMIGDGQGCIERGILESQILGVVTKAERKGEIITSNNLWWKFFRIVWIRIILFRKIIRMIYSKIR